MGGGWGQTKLHLQVRRRRKKKEETQITFERDRECMFVFLSSCSIPSSFFPSKFRSDLQDVCVFMLVKPSVNNFLRELSDALRTQAKKSQK